MDLIATLTLFVIMLALAATPSASVALVIMRSASYGVPNGAAVAAGIVAGDLVFMTLALLGMSVLAETLGALFAMLKYLAGGYLVWLGLGLLKSTRPMTLPAPDTRRSTLLASFASGFLLTLGDVKAILFYASLFPTFLDMGLLSASDVALMAAVTMLTVGGVKLAYAFAARRLLERLRLGQARQQQARTLAGGVLIGTGVCVIAKA